MQSIESNALVQAVRSAATEVFSTMLGLELLPGEASSESAASAPSDGVVALIGLAGAWIGTGSVSCSADFACRIASRMLLMDAAAVDGDVLDAVAEITNMVIGNVKTTLEERLGPMGLSIPTVVYGKNFTTKSMNQSEWIAVPFLCGEDRLAVRICLAPNHQPHHPPHYGYARPYSIEA